MFQGLLRIRLVCSSVNTKEYQSIRTERSMSADSILRTQPCVVTLEENERPSGGDADIEHSADEHTMVAGVENLDRGAIDEAQDAIEDGGPGSGRRPGNSGKPTFGQLCESDGKIELLFTQNIDGVKSAGFEVTQESAIPVDGHHGQRRK